MYYGWIILPEKEPKLAGKIISECDLFLKEKDTDGSYNVELSDKGMENLDKYWGSAYWGLEYLEKKEE